MYDSIAHGVTAPDDPNSRRTEGSSPNNGSSTSDAVVIPLFTRVRLVHADLVTGYFGLRFELCKGAKDTMVRKEVLAELRR